MNSFNQTCSYKMNISVWIKHYDIMGGTFYCNVSYVQDPTHFAFRNQGEGVSPGGGSAQGVSARGGVCPGMCLSRGSVFPGVSAQGVCVCQGGCLPGCVCVCQTPPCEQNDRCLWKHYLAATTLLSVISYVPMDDLRGYKSICFIGHYKLSGLK